MKNILFLLTVAVIVSSCTASKELTAGKGTIRKEKKIAEQTAIKQAIESRRYIVKVNRMFSTRGGIAELVPQNNYVIVDGEVASVSLGYLGRSYIGRGITGINFSGHTIKYEMVNNAEKGKYDINMKVAWENYTFDFYLSVNSSGYCSLSVINPDIQSVSYRGQVVPVTGSAGTSANQLEKL